MSFADEEIAVVMQNIWLSTLGMTTRLADAWPQDALSGPTLDGIINITGDWQGAVAVQVPRALGARIAETMFRLDDVPPTLEDMQDALGEITNMTGGNIKALLSGTCHLSLPAVIEGHNYSVRVPSTRMVARLVFDCEGMPAVVSIMAGGEVLPAAGGNR